MSITYTISDGQLTLHLEVDYMGLMTVTSPDHPGLVTTAWSVPHAFSQARDAIRELQEARKGLLPSIDYEDLGKYLADPGCFTHYSLYGTSNVRLHRKLPFLSLQGYLDEHGDYTNCPIRVHNLPTDWRTSLRRVNR